MLFTEYPFLGKTNQSSAWESSFHCR